MVTLPLGFLTLVYAMLSPMACDSCDGEAADRFDASFEVAFPLAMTGLLLALALLVAAWSLPRRARHTPRRILLAIAAPITTGLTWLTFLGLVAWPR
ncbi:hypothetical protein AB6O49_10205 [Streptomyces sp. SBR177]